MKKQKSIKTNVPDTLTYFFTDVANSHTIGGKRDYLPLTRRVERGRLLMELSANKDSETLRRIECELKSRLTELQNITSVDAIEIFLSKAADEIETFLDNTEWDEPPCVKVMVNLVPLADEEKRTHVRESSWKCFYLLALFPDVLRGEWNSQTNSQALIDHFQHVLSEYEESKRTLIEGTLRYSVRLARHYLHSGVPYLDLVQEGLMGLMYSIDKFQEVAGAHFQSYAATWIRQRITRYIGESSRLIRIPVHQNERISSIDQAISKLSEKLNCLPSDYEIFVELGWLNPEDIALLRQYDEQKNYHEMLNKLEKFGGLLVYRNMALSQIPKEVRQKIIALDNAYQAFNEEKGYEPDSIALFQRLGWLSSEEVHRLNNPPPKNISKRTSEALSSLKKAQNQLKYYRITKAQHYSIENSLQTTVRQSTRLVEDYLVGSMDTQDTGDSLILSDAVQQLLSRLNEREQEVISLRFGLADGKDRTLEEVGQMFGVTRERIRQIEAKALRKLTNPARNHEVAAFRHYEPSKIAAISERSKQSLLRKIHKLEQLPNYAESDDVAAQEANIDKMIEKYIMQGQKRITTRNPYGSRASMFSKVLEATGKPMHYAAIHEEVLKILPADQHYPKDRTYATLFYGDQFQLLGNGMFGLSKWDSVTIDSSGEKTLQYCPKPLLPANASGRAFFESVMVGRDLLKRRPDITAQTFYAEMQAWAQQEDNNWINTQSAFDAWYAAGLIEHVDVMNNSNVILQMGISPDARLNDVRLHCLDALCRRVLKMPELLLTLKRIARPTIPDIQKVLFGGERAGFDVPYRLNMLAAFEAVQRVDDEWRLTPIGEAVLQAHPPQELPDFSVIDEVTAETEDTDDLIWEDELGLLDL